MPRGRQPFLALRPYSSGLGTSEDTLQGNMSIAGSSYRIKVTQAQLTFSTDVIDTTGEYANNLGSGVGGEAAFVYDTNMTSLTQIRGQSIFSGQIPDANAVGIEKLEDAAGHNIDVKFLVGRGVTASADQPYYVSFRMVVNSIQINWSIDEPYVGVTITGQLTDQHGGSGDPVEESNA